MTKICAHVQELGVDPNLYSYVFGESVLNDAVAIVLYRSVRCALQNVANVLGSFPLTKICSLAFDRTVLSFVSSTVNGRGIEFAISFFIANFIGSFSIGRAAIRNCFLWILKMPRPVQVS